MKNEAVNPRSRAPALERNALEAPASSEDPGRQEPPEQRVPRLEPRNKDIPMQHDAVDLIVRLGRFAMGVVAVCVVVMLLISFIDRHPRGPKSGDDH